jgi:hypothetical protein
VVAETPASAETSAPEEDAEDIKQVYERLRKIMYGEPPQPEQTPETPETPSTDPKLEEEENQLAAIRKDWPEIDKLIQATIQRTRAEVERQMKAELDRLRQEIEPVAKATQTLSQEQYTSAVLAAHPDTQQILPSMLRWIDKQPDYLKTAYVRAYHSPNPADAIDLINRYKADAGLKNSQPVVDEKKEEKKHKLKLLQQPGTRRTGVLSQADPADYEGAFAEAAAMLDKAAR